MEIITFDFIYNCWKKNSYPDDFDNLLDQYIRTKNEIFSSNLNIKEPTSWLSKILVAIEIGILRNEERFEPYKKYWETLLNKKFKISIEDRWVIWD